MTTTETTVKVALNSHGEVVDVNEADQFQVNKTQFACGFFTCAILRSMVKPGSGKVPTLSNQQEITDALNWYAQYDGTPAITNTNGMTSEQLYELLHQIGLHYQATNPDAATARKWIAAGYPLAAAVMEASIRDLGLGGVNPYPWKAAGSHVISLTGLDAQGNFLARDSANCTNLYDPKSLRPGPRTYDAASMQFVSLTVVVPPWMPQPSSNVPPAQPPVESDPTLTVPKGWKDDGTNLFAPNGVRVVLGFRHYILTHPWDPADVPLVEEQGANPVEMGSAASGPGTRLLCLYTELGYTAEKGVYVIPVGRELATALTRLATLLAQNASAPAPTSVALPQGMKQNLSTDDLLISWSIVNSGIPFDPTRPITALWIALMQAGYGIGAAISQDMTLTVNTIPVTVQLFEGGRIFQAKERDGSSRVWVQLVGQVRLPGSSS